MTPICTLRRKWRHAIATSGIPSVSKAGRRNSHAPKLVDTIKYAPAKDRGGPLFKAFILEYTETSNLCREVMRYCR